MRLDQGLPLIKPLLLGCGCPLGAGGVSVAFLSKLMYEQTSTRDTSTLAMVLFRIGLVIAFFVIVGRLFQLQIIQGKDYQNKSNHNRLKTIEITAPRGVVYDRNGVILTRNKPS